MNDKPSFWETHGKAILAFAFTVYTVALPLYSSDHHISATEGVVIVLAIGNNLMVYIIPMTRSFPAVKSTINAVMAGLVVLQTVIQGGVDANDVALIIGAIVSALGVTIAPAFSRREGVKVGLGSDAPEPV